jgi:hypothetical protein
MAGRGATTFQKRQKEQARREKRDEKMDKRLQKKHEPKGETALTEPLEVLMGPRVDPFADFLPNDEL